MNQRKAYIYGMAAVLLWSTVATAFKVSLRHLNHMELLLWSNLFAVCALGIGVAVTRRIPELIRTTRKQLLRSMLLGLLNPFLYYMVVFKSYQLLPAQEAQPLNFTWALTLAVLSVPLLRHRFRWNDGIGLLIGYIGVCIIATGGNLTEFRISNPLGTGLALGSTIIWALYWIYNTNDERHPVVCLFTAFAFSLVPAALCISIFGTWRIPPLPGLYGAAYAGLFEMSITYLLWLSAMRLTEDAAKITGLIFLAPFVSLILIHFIVGETIKPSTITGLCAIIAGLSLQKYGQKSSKRHSNGLSGRVT